MPNSWMYNDYSLTSGFINKLKEKGTHRVGMTGACTLIKRKVFDNEFVNWNTIYNIDFSIWEDRAFCIKVASAGFEIYTDTNYPATHLYREEDYIEHMKRGELVE
jgi:GT2 family glycosyltransferase